MIDLLAALSLVYEIEFQLMLTWVCFLFSYFSWQCTYFRNEKGQQWRTCWKTENQRFWRFVRCVCHAFLSTVSWCSIRRKSPDFLKVASLQRNRLCLPAARTFVPQQRQYDDESTENACPEMKNMFYSREAPSLVKYLCSCFRPLLQTRLDSVVDSYVWNKWTIIAIL